MAQTGTMAVPGKPAAHKWRRFWSDLSKNRWPYIFIAPFFIFFFIFGLYPVLSSLYLSFTTWKGLGPITNNGLANYELLFRDSIFWKSVTNGVILFFMYVPIMLFLALVLATALNSRRVRAFRFFRTLIFIPYITNIVAAGFTFKLMLNQKYGLVNALLGLVGVAPVPWLESEWGGRVSLCLLIVWAWLGYNMVIMLAGLQTIPQELNEAALIDGANPIQSFFYVTVPLMRPVILFCVVLSLMGSFNLFGENFVLTNGGPMNATITPIIAMFYSAFRDNRLGYAAAQSYIYFAIIFVLTLLQVRYFGKEK